ncbi:HlyD family secretion protein [Halalkalibaculum sp. DA384]
MLFPEEIIKETTQYHFWHHSVRSQIIYSSMLFTLVGILALLPFIHMDVSVKSQGIIRPEVERKVLLSPVSGKISHLALKENKTFAEEMLVARIASPILEKRLNYNRTRQLEIEQFIQDLTYLVQLDSARIFNRYTGFKSALFKRSLIAFQQKLQKAAIEWHNARKRHKRQQALYHKEAISVAKLEESEFALEVAANNYRLMFDQQLAEWEAKLIQYQQEKDELRTEEIQLMDEQREFEIHMPVTGTVQNLAGISEGSYVRVNQQLAEISPDTGLVAECYVSPREIGLLKEGMIAYFQVDAFDYNQWGMLTGKVIEISNDAITNNDQPFFRVRAELDRSYLELPNGYKGYLKKGMTLQARFKVTERSLFQLLYDNVDDWLNPVTDGTERNNT